MPETTVTTTAGDVKGVEIATGVVFRGIPYAAPPVGERRHVPPQPPESWSGVRDCDTFGPICPQIPPSVMGGLMQRDDEPMDEDCLYLNVWTPAIDDGRRPTVVWLHGGGYALGSGSAWVYDGGSFARDGVVFVSLNYRLHALGFLYLDRLFEGAQGTGNLGPLDQVAALRWVRDNIARFGGDPDNVTVAGQSAGAMSVATLLATPAATGLYRRAVAQSGAGHHSISADAAGRVTERVLDILEVRPGDWGALRAVPAARLVEVAMQVSQQEAATLLGDERGVKMSFLPVADGTTRSARPIDLLAEGAAPDVDLLVGTTADESRVFFFSAPPEVQAQLPDPDVAPYFASSGRTVDEVLETYAEHQPANASRRDLLAAVETDQGFTIPAVRLAEARRANGSTVFVYRFAWRTPVLDGRLGACHILDVPFWFETHRKAADFVGDNPPDDLAATMHGAFVRFAKTGDPNGEGLPSWPAYDTERRPVLELGASTLVRDDPNGPVRRLWDGVL